jgi:TolB protein
MRNLLRIVRSVQAKRIGGYFAQGKRMRKALIKLVVAALIFLTSCSQDVQVITEGPTETIPPPTGTTLVYLSGRGGLGWQVFLTHNYLESFRLTGGPFDTQADWSPDKRWIVFVRGLPGGAFQVWKMHYGGDGKVALTPADRDCEGPRFSPDGRKIAFSFLNGGRYDIYVMDNDGGNWQQLTDSVHIPFWRNATFAMCDWSPDGQSIVFTFYLRDGGIPPSRVGILNLATGGFRHVEKLDPLEPYQLRWSPVSNELVFVGTAAKIYRSDTDGTNVVELAGLYSYEPDWSADGKEIAYSHVDSLESFRTVWMMDRDGMNKIQRIVSSDHHNSGPVW